MKARVTLSLLAVSLLLAASGARAADEPVRLRGKTAAEWVEDLPRDQGRPAAVAALKEMGADAVPALRAALRGEDARLAMLAAAVLAELGPNAAPAVEDLTATVASGSTAPLVRRLSVIALGFIGTPAGSAVPVVLPLATSEDEGLRQSAIEALGAISAERPADVAPVLEQALSDDNAQVRGHAATALGRLAVTGAREKLEALAASDPNADVQAAAARAVERLGGATPGAGDMPTDDDPAAGDAPAAEKTGDAAPGAAAPGEAPAAAP